MILLRVIGETRSTFHYLEIGPSPPALYIKAVGYVIPLSQALLYIFLISIHP